MQIGQKVVCINDDWPPMWRDHWMTTCAPEFPVKGQVYTIRAIVTRAIGDAGLRFVEIKNPEVNCVFEGQSIVAEIVFRASYFRPLVERKTDISIFTRLLTPQKESVDA